MRLRLAVILTCIISCIVSCSKTTDIKLSWNIKDTTYYHITKESFPIEIDINANLLLSDKNVLKDRIDTLKSLKITPENFPMLLEMKKTNNHFVKVVARNNPAVTKNENKAPPGLVQLNTDISQYGVNQNNYINQQQKNLVALLFQLPNKTVDLETSWQLPVTLTSLNTPFLADKTNRINKVWVNSITNKQDAGLIVEIIYLIEEEVSGMRQQLITDDPIPFKVLSSYFAVGEFLVEKKQWLNYIGRLDTAVGPFRTVDLIALSPAEKNK